MKVPICTSNRTTIMDTMKRDMKKVTLTQANIENRLSQAGKHPTRRDLGICVSS